MSFSDRGMQLLATLRQKRKDAAAANAEPEFGPLPSKAIFESKWLAKLNAHNLAWPLRNVGPEPVQETALLHTMQQLAPHLSTSADLVSAFNKEALALRLDYYDFADQPIPGDGGPGDVVFANPFAGANSLATLVNFWAATGDETISLKLRRHTEVEKERVRDKFEIFRVKVFEAEEAGEWKISEADKQLVARFQDEDETRAQKAGQGHSKVDGQRRKWW